MSDLENLRKQVAKQQKAVANKIARTKRNTGANVAGSEFDPRRPGVNVNRLRESGLRSYLSDLNHFMRRPNQFVSGQGGAPIPRGYYEGVYKKNEAAVEAVRVVRDKQLGGIVTPTGLTVRQQKAAIPEAGGSSVYGPYKKFDRQAIDVKDFKALQRLNADMVKRLNADYLKTEIGKGRENIRKVAEYLGEAGIVEQTDDLDDYQFDLLWFGTNYADRLFLYYELVKERQEGTKKERKQDRVIETQFAGIGELIEWAKNQSPDEGTESVKGFKR